MHRMKHLHLPLVACLLCLAFNFLLEVKASADSIVVDKNGVKSASDWVVHEASGRVFCSIRDGNEVIEFAPRIGEVRRFRVGAQPDELLIKDNLLIVGCWGATALYAIDLDANKEAGMVKLNGKGPYALFCSRASDPYVYCVCNTGDAWWDGEIFQVNTKEMRLRKTVRVQGWGQSHPTHVAMSPDGKWIVPDARGAHTPTGADLMKVDAEELSFTQIRDYHASFGPMVAGPLNRHWTFGGTLYSLDISKKLRTFSGRTCAIHPKYDLVAGLNTDGLVILQKFGDASEIGRGKEEISVPKVTTNQSRSSSSSRHRSKFDPTLQFDLKNDLVFVGMQKGGYWIDLNEYRDQLEPLRVVIAPSEHSTRVDQPMQLPVSITNPQELPKASLTITSGPKGATIEGDRLRWQPSPENLGVNIFTLTVRSADGTELDSAEVKIEVTLPKVELDFTVKAMKLAPNGNTLVAWGASKGQDNRHPAHTGPDTMAVIDTKAGKVIAQKEIPQGIRDLAIDDRYVFLAPSSGNLFYRVTHRLQDSKRQFLQATPTQLIKVSPKTLLVNGSTFELFDVENMKAIRASSDQNNMMRLHSSQLLLPGQTVKLFGKVTNRKTGEILRFESSRLPSLANVNTRSSYSPSSSSNTPKAWGRRMTYNGVLSNHRGSRIGQVSNVQVSTISEDFPVGILVSQSNAGRVVQKTLRFVDLVDGTVRQSSMIQESKTGQRYPSYNGTGRGLLVDGKNIFIASGAEIQFAEIPDSLTKTLLAPPHFLEKQKLVLDTTKENKFTLAVGGKRDGLSFSLLSEYEGIQLVEKTGEVVVDNAALWQNLQSQAIKTPASSFPRNTTALQVFDPATNARLFKELTGKDLPTGMLAATLPINANLRDSEGQEDAIQFQVVVIGAAKPITETIEKAKEEQQLAREKAQERSRERALAQQKAREMAQQKDRNAPQGVEERLNEIEARLRRLEAALDSVLKKLDGK